MPSSTPIAPRSRASVRVTRSIAALAALFAALFVGATACGGGTSDPTSVGGNASRAVAIAPGGRTMVVGDTASFRFFYTANDSTVNDALWSTNDTTRLVIVRRGVVLAKAATPGKMVCAAVPTNTALSACASVSVQ